MYLFFWFVSVDFIFFKPEWTNKQRRSLILGGLCWFGNSRKVWEYSSCLASPLFTPYKTVFYNVVWSLSRGQWYIKQPWLLAICHTASVRTITAGTPKGLDYKRPSWEDESGKVGGDRFNFLSEETCSWETPIPYAFVYFIDPWKLKCNNETGNILIKHNKCKVCWRIQPN